MGIPKNRANPHPIEAPTPPPPPAGRDLVDRSPPTRAVSASVTRPLNEVTSPVTRPEIDTSPLNEVTEPRTVPSIVAGPLKITTSPTVWPWDTTTSPVITICGSGSDEAAAGVASAPRASTEARDVSTIHRIGREATPRTPPFGVRSRPPRTPQRRRV